MFVVVVVVWVWFLWSFSWNNQRAEQNYVEQEEEEEDCAFAVAQVFFNFVVVVTFGSFQRTDIIDHTMNDKKERKRESQWIAIQRCRHTNGL